MALPKDSQKLSRSLKNLNSNFQGNKLFEFVLLNGDRLPGIKLLPQLEILARLSIVKSLVLTWSWYNEGKKGFSE